MRIRFFVMAVLGVLAAGQTNWPPQTRDDLKDAVDACFALSRDGNCPTYTCVGRHPTILFRPTWPPVQFLLLAQPATRPSLLCAPRCKRCASLSTLRAQALAHGLVGRVASSGHARK